MDALEMSLLYDYYGGLLTGKQRQCFDLRYNQDLSLGEIAQVMGVSRQAVNGPTDAHLLEIVEGSPVLDLVRTTYNESNEVVEYTLSVARADQFKYKVYHQRSD